MTLIELIVMVVIIGAGISAAFWLTSTFSLNLWLSFAIVAAGIIAFVWLARRLGGMHGGKQGG